MSSSRTRPPGAGARPPASGGGALSLQDCICHLYERSLVPVREIARFAGITERNVYATVRRRGCAPRMRLGPGGGRRMVLLSDGGSPGELDEQAVMRLKAACVRAREHLQQTAAANAELRRRKVDARQSRREIEADGRVLSVLTRALSDLARVDDLVATRHGAKDKSGHGKEQVKRRRPYQWRPMVVAPPYPRPKRD
jgi:hypothetical protein